MHLEHLNYIYDIAKTHSFSISAERLFVSQPALSQAIKNLEQSWGIQLFHRSKSGVTCTEACERILPCIGAMLEQYDELKRITSDTKEEHDEKWILNISCTPYLAYTYIPRIIPDIYSTFPNVKLSVTHNLSRFILDDIRNGLCDMYIFYSNDKDPMFRSGMQDLHMDMLYQEKLYLLTRKDSVWAGRKSVTPADLKDVPISSVNYAPSQNGYLISPKEEAALNIVLTTTQPEIMISHVMGGFSEGLITNTALEYVQNNENLKAVPLNAPYPTALYSIYRDDNPKMDIIRFITELLYKA